MPRREDRTEELDPLDLPPPSEGEHTIMHSGPLPDDDQGAPTEMMDRQAMLGLMKQRRPQPVRPTEPPPPSERTVFGNYDPHELTGETVLGVPLDEAPESEPPPTRTADEAQALADVERLERTRYVPDGAGEERTGVTSTSSLRRPPPPPAPPASRRPFTIPRRPAGFPVSSPFTAPPPEPTRTPNTNPFLPPPSKFFQAPSGPGRSKPRESTFADIDPADRPPPSEPAPESISSVSIELALPEVAAPQPLPPPPPRSVHSAPIASSPLGMPPPPPPRAVAPPPKPVVTVPEVPPFDYELEARLRERQDWPRLVELYAATAQRDEHDALEHALQAADILHEQMGEYDRAFFQYLEALVLVPQSPRAAIGIERAAHELGIHAKAKWSEATRRLKKVSDQSGEPNLRAEYLALLFRWNNQELRRRDLAAEIFSRLSELAPRHPTVLERKANEARARGDAAQQRQLLLEALPLVTRDDDRIRVHLALAELLEGPLASRAAALPHYEAILEQAPDHFDALRGLERAVRETHDPARLRDVLERMVAAAASAKDRLEPLIRLAETLEKDLADPAAAASALEEALLIDPQNSKALAALERCHEALGHWAEVARTMQRRAEILTAPRAKIDLLFSAGEVLESRAYDMDGAMGAYRMVLTVDAKNRRALGELRRLSDVLGLLDDAISFGTRLAEVTPDKREAARLFSELAHQLEQRGEVQLARTQLERALELDKRSRPIHLALERLARSAGADERARHFLEQRAKLTEEKPEAAELYAQLGRERREAGDPAGALEAYASAFAANPAQEEAASVLLDFHVEQGNFRAVEPLLDLLIAAARRDRDDTRTLHLLRLATRTAASLGKLDNALQAAMAAFDHAPTDAGTRSDLLEVAARTSPEKLGVAREHLARVAESAEGISTSALVRLAESQYAAGDTARAIATLEQAHDQSPNDIEPLESLETILEAEQMWERLATIKVEHARMLPLAEEDLHFRLLADAGDLWARRLGDVRAASEAFEEARILRPDDAWLLETLAWAYREVEEWHKLAEMLETLITSADTPAKERELLLELAALQTTELHDTEGAAGTLDRVLERDPAYLAAFETLVRMLTDSRNWAALEKAYRKMLLRTKGSSRESLELALWKQLGLVYRDRLGNNKNALEAFQAALERAPADEELHRIVVELNLLLGDLDGAIEQARKRVLHAPFEPETYQTLYDLFSRRGSYDLAWCALDVMAQLVALEGDEEEFYAGYPPFPLDEIPGTLTEEAWQTHLLDRDMDPTLTSLFAWATPAEVRLLERSSSYIGHQSLDVSMGGGVSLTAIIENGAEILGMVNPPLYHADNAHMPLRPAAAPSGAFLVDHARAMAEQETLAFHVGRGLSWLRSELLPLAFFATVEDLAGFLSRLVRQDPDLYFAMTEDERSTVAVIIDQATTEGAKLDVRKWLILAHASSVRAAVLLSGTVHDAAVFYSQAEDDEHASEKLISIYQFAVSEEHSELRTAIGTAISQAT